MLPSSHATLRRERPGDADAIASVHLEAFDGPAESALVGALRDANRLTSSWVAFVDDMVAGHAAFSHVTVEGGANGWGLAPVGVLAARRRQGIAAALITRGLDDARDKRVPYVVVLGDPAYYPRFGFVAASGRGLRSSWEAGDAFQVLVLDEERTPTAGHVRYAPELESL